MLPITLLTLVLTLPAQITGVTPPEGAIGTLLTIEGTGFGQKKPVLKLVDPQTGKKTPLAVGVWSDSHVEATLKKGPPAGPRDLLLDPKGKDTAALLAPGAFTIRAPQPLSVSPGVAGPQDQVTVSGQFFGSKKGKLFIGGKKAKVSAWTDGSITALVPKASSSGVVDVRMVNSVGEATLGSVMLVLGAGELSGPDFVALEVGGEPLAALVAPAALALQADGQLVLGGSFGVGTSLQITLPVDVAALAVPQTIAGDPLGSIAWRAGAPLIDPAATLWTTAAQGDDYEVQLLALLSGRLVGVFHATAARTEGSAPPPTQELAAGLFVVSVPDGP